VEEILAMILIHGKQLAEKQIESGIRECVFTIPSNWDLPKRHALYTSAQLANLTVLSFIKENTAAALAYGFERQDLETSHLALFYNLGSSSAKVSLVEYTAVNVSNKTIENVRVLADETDEEVSTRHFDMVLTKHLAEAFDALPERKGNFFVYNIYKNKINSY
jgi:molecular chaperone DnaK